MMARLEFLMMFLRKFMQKYYAMIWDQISCMHPYLPGNISSFFLCHVWWMKFVISKMSYLGHLTFQHIKKYKLIFLCHAWWMKFVISKMSYLGHLTLQHIQKYRLFFLFQAWWMKFVISKLSYLGHLTI